MSTPRASLIEPMAGERQCRKCLACYPLGDFTGNRTECRACRLARYSDYGKSRKPVERKVEMAGERECRICLVTYPLRAFVGGRTQCRACRNAYHSAYDKAHPRTRSQANKDQPKSPWNVPADPRTSAEKLLAATQQAWRYPVAPAQNLRWAA